MKLHMPLMWVAERHDQYGVIEATYRDASYTGQPDSRLREVAAFGQQIAFAPSGAAQVATLPTESLRFLGKAEPGGSTPRMSSAKVVIPALQQLSPGPPTPIFYHPLYKNEGFESPNNTAEMWAKILLAGEVDEDAKLDPAIALPELRFGKDGTSTDKSGGFLAPSVPIRGLSRVTGAVGSADDNAAKLKFTPKDFFQGSSPKLFGIVPLEDLALNVDSDLLRIPKIISEFVGRVEALVDDIARAATKVADAAAEAKRIASESVDKPQEWKDAIAAAINKSESLEDSFAGFKDKIGQALELVKSQGKSGTATSFVNTLKAELNKTIEDLEKLAADLPTVVANLLRAVANLLRTSLDGTIDLIEDMFNYVNGIAQNGSLARVQFEWKPRVQSWKNATSPLLEVKEDSLVFAIGAQAGIQRQERSLCAGPARRFHAALVPGRKAAFPLLRPFRVQVGKWEERD